MKNISATQFLRDEQKVIQGLLVQVQARFVRTPEMVESILKELFMTLEIHTQLEERIFYPAFQNFSQLDKTIEKRIQELHEIKRQLDRLRSTPYHHNGFSAAFAELTTSVQAHLQADQSELFPEAEKILKESFELGEKMWILHAHLVEQSAYSDAREMRDWEKNADEVDQAAEEPVRRLQGFETLVEAIQSEALEEFPMDREGLYYSFGDIEFSDDGGDVIPVRDLIDHLEQNSYGTKDELLVGLKKALQTWKNIEVPLDRMNRPEDQVA